MQITPLFIPVLLSGNKSKVPTWVPKANGKAASLYASFANRQYYYNGQQFSGDAPGINTMFNSWLTAIGGTFSRTGNALLYDSTGKLTYAPSNQLTYSDTFSNAAWTLTNATIPQTGPTAPDGTVSWTLTDNTTNSEHRIFQGPISNPATARAIKSVYAKAGTVNFLGLSDGNAGNGWVVFNLALGTVDSASVISGSITSQGNGWYRCSILYTNPVASDYHVINIGDTAAHAVPSVPWVGTGSNTIYVANAQFELVTYQTTPSTYNPTTASAYYGPRFDYDPVALTAKGILLEGSRTNLALQSNTFNTTWAVAVDAVLASAAGTSPDGTNNFWKLKESTTATAGHWIIQSITKAASALPYTFSIYAKAAERTRLFVQCDDGTGGNGGAVTFDLAGGQIGIAASVFGTGWASPSATIANIGGGVYRCTFTVTTNTTTAIRMNLYLDAASGTGAQNITYAGVIGDGILIYGAQLEQASFASSYIPTTTASVTRAADSLTWAYAPTKASLFAQADTANVTAARFIAQIDDTTANNRNSLTFNASAAGAFDVLSGGVSQAGLSNGTVTANTAAKLAAAFNTNDFALDVAAGVVQTDAAGTVPTVTTLRLGADASGANNLYGHIAQFAYWDGVRVTNASLQSLTT